ncbi:MAG: phage tail protein [Leptolyngbya sp.]|nr:MAG: phage tail protein [Leptolyngbya sp.]
MPEYLAPGVYVEETSFRAKSIEGVGTSTTGFVGATRYGPVSGEPELMTSFGQFERIYGGLDLLDYPDNEVVNYLAHAVRAFFDNGGSRLYVARAYLAPDPPIQEVGEDDDAYAARVALVGRGTAIIPAAAAEVEQVNDLARTASNTILTALDRAIASLEQAQAGATRVLQAAVNQVQAEAPGTGVTAGLVFTYGDGDDDIGTQLAAAIAALSDGAAKTDLETALAAWQGEIDAADAALQSANAQLDDSAATRTRVAAAYDAGAAAGTGAALPTDPDLPALATAGNTLRATANAIAQAVNGLPALATALTEALVSLATEAAATTATAAIQALTDAAEQVLDLALNAEDQITAAANLATLEGRVAIANTRATWVARFPGAAGNLAVAVTGRLGANVLAGETGNTQLRQVRPGDLVIIRQGSTALIHSAQRVAGAWQFEPISGGNLTLVGLNPATDQVIPLTLTVEVLIPGKFAQTQAWEGLTVSALPARARDSVSQVFGAEIANRMQALETPLVLQAPTTLRAAQLAADLLNQADWFTALEERELVRRQRYSLIGGSDGQIPSLDAYQGDATTDIKSGLLALEDLEEISIVAAPGYSHDWANRRPQILAISQALITHCENMRYRVAVLDSPNDQSLSGVREYRALLDTTRAALYYPWVRILDPVSDQEIIVPSSGFMAGIYARNDVQIGVHKAPANEVVRGAIGLETLINKAQQDVLNPLGINCIRFFEGRGIRVWGARTVSSDPEWKYLNIRRYFVYLEASIDRATQWAVFEPNGDRLWANVRRAVESFLETEWRDGRLAGAKVEEAFFVRCDRSTMTQNDLDNGRMICLIGVSPLYPAEFVIFRIGQWTADRRA